jgi:hypothetical protein
VYPTPDLLTHRADAEFVPVFKLQYDAVGVFLVGYLAEAEFRHAASLAAASRGCKPGHLAKEVCWPNWATRGFKVGH